jgi:hypothetical protein
MGLLFGLTWLFWTCGSGPAAGQPVQEAEIRWGIANADLAVDGSLSTLPAWSSPRSGIGASQQLKTVLVSRLPECGRRASQSCGRPFRPVGRCA